MFVGLCAILIGLSLGLLGAGGSILTTPILIYLLGMPEKMAIAAALAIVFLVSLTAWMVRRRDVEWRTALMFLLPGVLGSSLGVQVGAMLSAVIQVSLFCLLMLIAAWRLGKHREEDVRVSHQGKMLAAGFIVGLLTGVIGVGGGFLLFPALIAFAGLTVTKAAATSLVIISVQSLIGFLGYQYAYRDIDYNWPWSNLLLVALVASVSAIIGARVANRVPQQVIRQVFSACLVCLSLSMIFTTYYPLFRS